MLGYARRVDPETFIRWLVGLTLLAATIFATVSILIWFAGLLKAPPPRKHEEGEGAC